MLSHSGAVNLSASSFWLVVFHHHVLPVCSPSLRLLVEKIFAQYMVPHSLDTEEKMKCLYYLYACLDTNAVKSVVLPYTHTHTHMVTQ